MLACCRESLRGSTARGREWFIQIDHIVANKNRKLLDVSSLDCKVIAFMGSDENMSRLCQRTELDLLRLVLSHTR